MNQGPACSLCFSGKHCSLCSRKLTAVYARRHILITTHCSSSSLKNCINESVTLRHTFLKSNFTFQGFLMIKLAVRQSFLSLYYIVIRSKKNQQILMKNLLNARLSICHTISCQCKFLPLPILP